MQLIVAVEGRFDRTPDGAVWTDATFMHSFWTRYLNVFDDVTVVARVRDVATAPARALRADGAGVSFAALPHYIGPLQYLRSRPQINRICGALAAGTEAVILRVPSVLGVTLARAMPVNRPYAVEVVGDPYDVFAPGSSRHPLRMFFRWWFVRQLKEQCRAACAAAYVTEAALQKRYPIRHDAYSTHYSSIQLEAAACVAAPRTIIRSKSCFSLITVATLAQLYKAPDVLIRAVHRCTQQGLDLNLTIVGDGRCRSDLELLCRELDLGACVKFVGQLPAGEAIRAQLDAADVFVLPSHTEGLPRAMIEAMARALPCIGSTAGGIPELLPAADMVPPGDVDALARKIQEVVTNPLRMSEMSARNLEKARQYRDDMLGARRLAFYRHVHAQTEAWARSQSIKNKGAA